MAVRLGNNAWTAGEDLTNTDLNDTFDGTHIIQNLIVGSSGGGDINHSISTTNTTYTLITKDFTNYIKSISGNVRVSASFNAHNENASINLTWLYTVTYEDDTTEDFTIDTANYSTTGNVTHYYYKTVSINTVFSKYVKKIEFKVSGYITTDGTSAWGYAGYTTYDVRDVSWSSSTSSGNSISSVVYFV